MTKAAELAKWGEVSTNGQVSGRRNIIINGAMQVAQRGTSQAGITVSANEGYTTVDRFGVFGAAHAGVLTAAQVADGPSGFANCLKLTCTTADTSTAAGELQHLETRFEGQDVQQIKKGTADAEKVTVSFYVKGDANATYQLELQDQDNSRFNAQTFAVTTDWTRVVLTYAADVDDGSSPFDDDNALSLRLVFWFNAGSTYTGGTFTSNTWHETANQRCGAITNFFDSTDRRFFITGLQMEVGSQATPFEHRSFGEELALCQRYAWKYGGNISDEYLANVGFYSDGNSIIFGQVRHPVIMRTTPTLIVVGSPIVKANGSATTGFTPVIASTSVLGGFIDMQKNSHGLTSTDQTVINCGATTDHFFFDAEL